MREVPLMRLRKIIFWLHLITGSVAGSVIFVMSVTGVLLAFERQIVAFAEREALTVNPPAPGAPHLGLDTLVAKAREATSEGMPSGVTLRADPTAAALVTFGREQNVFVNPYTGAVLGEGAKTLRGFFRVVTDWHRWLGTRDDNREVGRAITGACNAAFVVLVITGFYLWWPRRWTRAALRTVTVPSLKLRGKPRDWNWHNAVGFWSAPALLCIALTGLVMSYQWANNLIYTLTGSEPPPLPQRNATQMTVMIEETKARHPYPRSTLTLDTATAAVVSGSLTKATTWGAVSVYGYVRSIPVRQVG
jgi:uncharacterized iron-regulated membrane protein